MPYQVILVGASGLIGSHLLSELIESAEISRILLLLRKPLNITDPKVQELIVNIDELEYISSDIRGDFCLVARELQGQRLRIQIHTEK